MKRSRGAAFVAAVGLCGALLALIGSGYFSKTEVSAARATKPVLMAQDDTGSGTQDPSSGGGSDQTQTDTDSVEQIQPSELQEQQNESSSSGGNNPPNS